MSKKKNGAPIYSWLTAPMPCDVERELSRLSLTEGVFHIAVMPDIHLARGICVGTVFGSKDRIFPEAIGGDLGCGMAAIRLESTNDKLNDSNNHSRLFSGLSKLVPSRVHSLGSRHDWIPRSLMQQKLSCWKINYARRKEGTLQFGTLGRGNHFLELQKDQDNRIWMMVHSGSRSMGQKIANYHLGNAMKSNTGFLYFEMKSEAGQCYLKDMGWALNYARENRTRILDSAVMLLSNLFGIEAEKETYFDSVHNFIRVEEHFGHTVVVHRKGANSAAKGEKSIVPGSMGTASFHVIGRGYRNALQSCSHGSGRSMSRAAAKARISQNVFQKSMRGITIDNSRMRYLIGEAPGAYKDIEAVMRAQNELVKRVNLLRPLLNYKGI